MEHSQKVKFGIEQGLDAYNIVRDTTNYIESRAANAVIDGMTVADDSVKYHIDEEWINDKVERKRSRLAHYEKERETKQLWNKDLL